MLLNFYSKETTTSSLQLPSKTPAIMTSPTADDTKTIEIMDADIERIQKVVRVRDPYFMTCAGSYSNRHHKHPVQARLERKDMPFEDDEDHLQYGTWIFRDKPGMVGHSNSCINLHGGIEEIERRKKKLQATSASPASLSGSSDPNTPKVRLSLKEYRKRKQEGIPTSPEAKPTIAILNEHRRSPHSSQDIPPVNGDVNLERTAITVAGVACSSATPQRSVKR